MTDIYCTSGEGTRFFSSARRWTMRLFTLALFNVFFVAGVSAFPLFFKTDYATAPQQCVGCEQARSALATPSVFNNLIVDGSLFLLEPSCQLVGPNRTCESTDRVVFIGTADLVGMNPTYQFTIVNNTANAVISGPSSGNYTGPVEFALVPGPGGFFTANGSVTVNFVVSRNGSVLTTCTQTMTIDPLPIANGAGLAACTQGGAAATFNLLSLNSEVTGGQPNVVTWYLNHQLTVPIANPGAFVSGSTVVYAKVTTTTTGCVNSAPISLAVVASPECSITGPGQNTVCAGSTGWVFQAPEDHAAYSWTVTGGTITSGQGTDAITVTAGGAGTLTVSLTLTNNNGCTSTCNVQIPIAALPVCVITGNNTICQGNSTSFTATGGTSYSWTGPGGFTASTATINNLTVAGTYTVTVTNAAGCTSSCSRTLTVNALPVCAITGVNNIPQGGSTSFTATGGVTYSWTGPNGYTANTATIVNLTVGGTYTVTVTNAAGCTSTCSRILTLDQGGPLPCLVSGPSTGCPGSSLMFSVPNTYATYAWTVTGGTISAGQGTSQLTVTAGASGSVVVTLAVTNPGGGSAVCTRTVTLNAAPVCMLTAPAMMPTCGSTNNTLTVPAGMANYQWTVTGNGTYVSGNGTNTLTYNVGTSGNTTVSLTVTNANGCTSTCSVTFSCARGAACTQGFWKTHPEVWNQMTDVVVAGGTVNGVTYPGMPAGLRFTTSTNFYTYYNIPAGSIVGIASDASMHTAGETGGGDCLNLARQGNAALLNVAAYGSGYLNGTGYTSFTQLYNTIRAAFLSGNCGTLASQLDMYNNRYHDNGQDQCGQLPGNPRGQGQGNGNSNVPERINITVTPFPNPYNDRINFTIRSEIAGMGTLELYGLLGEKIQTVYQGHIEKDAVKTVTYAVPATGRKTMIYQFRIGNEIVTGKVLYLN